MGTATLVPPPQTGPKILVLDIETAPMLGYVWRLFDENIGLNQLVADWHILSWAAKWLGDEPDKLMYRDQRNAKDIEDDRAILVDLHTLIDQADVLLTHNGKKFDGKKINARFVHHRMKPPSPIKHVDTYSIARRHFGFTSNKLAYLTERFNKTYTKLDHGEFPGFALWRAVLEGKRKAWRVMEKYNRHDVLALEELYERLAPWDTTNFFVYQDGGDVSCKCGSTRKKKNGIHYAQTRRYQRYKCLSCGYHWHDTRAIKETT